MVRSENRQKLNPRYENRQKKCPRSENRQSVDPRSENRYTFIRDPKNGMLKLLPDFGGFRPLVLRTSLLALDINR